MLTKVVSNNNVFEDYYLLEVEGRGIGRKAKPGQFFMLKVANCNDPLLRRPFCLHRVVNDNKVKMLYKAVGGGTKILSRVLPGDDLDVLGPLGNGYFKAGKGVKHAIIVGGGIGVAPLMALADHIKKTRPDIDMAVFIGGRTKDDVLGVKEFKTLGTKPSICTEDGSLAHKGRITEPLEAYLTKHFRPGTKGWTIYSCGPKPMLMSVAAIAAKHGIKNQASLEANMACGVGACIGCVISVLDRVHGGSVYKKVCLDGPVFDTADVDWTAVQYAGASARA